jgi:hypothetical protein
MSGITILLAVAGFLVTTLVIVGMILVTPRAGTDEVRVEGTENESRGQGAELSPVPAAEPSRPVSARA